MLHILSPLSQTVLGFIKRMEWKKRNEWITAIQNAMEKWFKKIIVMAGKNNNNKNLPGYCYFHKTAVVQICSGSQFSSLLGVCLCFLRMRQCQINWIVFFCEANLARPCLLGLNTSKNKAHIGSGSLFCGSLEENILSPLCKTNTNSVLAKTLFFVDTLL